ncbi:STAS domain-containing protein [Yinghuangia aomiensis]
MDTRQLTPTNRPLIGSGPQGRAVLAPTGELDEAASAVLRADACGLVARGHRNLVVDLSAVTFCDACSLSALIGIRRHALEAGGSLVLAAVPVQLREIAEPHRPGHRAHRPSHRPRRPGQPRPTACRSAARAGPGVRSPLGRAEDR